jgi:hypothetical protein
VPAAANARIAAVAISLTRRRFRPLRSLGVGAPGSIGGTGSVNGSAVSVLMGSDRTDRG